MKYLFYLFLLLIKNLVIITDQSFLSKEINGTFTNNYRMSVGINFLVSSGYLFYAIDSNGNELMIKLGEFFYLNRESIFTFNGKNVSLKSGIVSLNSINQFSTLLKFEKENLYHDYNNHLIISNVFKRDENFKPHSLPAQYKIGKNKTYIFIGRNPSNINLNNSYPNDFVGCLDFLYINYEKIILDSNRNEDVSNSCWKDLIHQICNETYCEKFQVIENLLDCTFSAVNVKNYCNRDLSNYQNQKNIFERIGNKNQSTGIKFIWKLENDTNYCLLELKLTDESVLLFYINENQVVVYNKKNNQTKTLFEKGPFRNFIHILIIKFDSPNIFIKASNGNLVNSSIIYYKSNVVQVNIGSSTILNKCQPLKGKTAFRYDLSEFQLIPSLNSNSSNGSSNDFKTSTGFFHSTWTFLKSNQLLHVIFTTILIIMNISLIISIIILVNKRKEKQEFPSIKSINIYETVHLRSSSLPNQSRNDLRASAEYDYIS